MDGDLQIPLIKADKRSFFNRSRRYTKMHRPPALIITSVMIRSTSRFAIGVTNGRMPSKLFIGRRIRDKKCVNSGLTSQAGCEADNRVFVFHGQGTTECCGLRLP